jgi:hypothetical protein
MRKFLLVTVVLMLAVLACQVDLSGLEATTNAAKQTIVGALTEVGGTNEAVNSPLNAAIVGELSYPSDHIPPLRVYAFDAATLDPVSSVDIALNQGTYELQVPAGTYYIVAYTMDGGFSGGYSQMVPCGLNASCTDHSLIEVTVSAGGTAGGINPGDWYAPEGSFPAMP